jgi:hypothetical protein
MHTYILTGRVIPERAVLDIKEIQFKTLASEDVPEGDLFVEILKSQISARFLVATQVQNFFTLRNTVEDAVRMLLDVAGYFHGYGYDVEIVQMVHSDSSLKQVFGIDVPALAGVCEKAGITYNDIFLALLKKDGGFLRHALADVREAIKSPRDTGFFCYRAIESLKNCSAVRNGLLPDDDAAWELFRNSYSIAKQQIMEIKTFADPARHGNHPLAQLMGDKERADVFKKAWEIINAYILGEKLSSS